MKDNMPRTPFSTPLSGSAKEAELRLKNIFSGPKRRPPILFLAAVFSLCIFCGDLVSCNVVEAEVPDVSQPEGTSTADGSQSVALTGPEDSSREWAPVELDAGMLQNNEHTLDGPYDEPLTDGEAALLEDLPADQLPREAVEVFQAPRRDYWRDTLLPVAFDEGTDLTVYFVVDPDSMPDMEPSDSPLLWGDLEQRGIVLRYGGQAKYFPLCWEGNAHYGSNPLLLADDLDGDGRPEAALVLCLGGGTGVYEQNLYIFDLDTMTYTVPDYSQVPLEITASPDGNTARLVSGERERKVDLTQLYEPFKGTVEVGNQVRFVKEDGQLVCDLDLDFSCMTLEYLASAHFPVIYEDGVYKLGPAVWLGDIL